MCIFFFSTRSQLIKNNEWPIRGSVLSLRYLSASCTREKFIGYRLLSLLLRGTTGSFILRLPFPYPFHHPFRPFLNSTVDYLIRSFLMPDIALWNFFYNGTFIRKRFTCMASNSLLIPAIMRPCLITTGHRKFSSRPSQRIILKSK